MLILKTSELPAALLALVRSANLKIRKVMILALTPGQTVDDGAIVACLGGAPVEQVSFSEGGGRRARAPVIVVRAWSGRSYIGIAAPEGRWKFNNAAEVAIAFDAALEVTS